MNGNGSKYWNCENCNETNYQYGIKCKRCGKKHDNK